MRFTALDIRNHTFQRAWSGVARDEVEAFLAIVSEDYEDLVRTSESLREQVVRLETQVEELSSNETILQETLTTAQRLSEDLKNTAISEAKVVLGEAEIKAEKVLDAAHRRTSKLAGDLRQMKNIRSQLAGSIRSTIDTHLELLNTLAKDPESDPSIGDDASYLARSENEMFHRDSNG